MSERTRHWSPEAAAICELVCERLDKLGTYSERANVALNIVIHIAMNHSCSALVRVLGAGAAVAPADLLLKAMQIACDEFADKVKAVPGKLAADAQVAFGARPSQQAEQAIKALISTMQGKS